MATVGSGAYTYEPVENWAKLPPGWSFKEIGGVGVDRHDNVFVFNRGDRTTPSPSLWQEAGHRCFHWAAHIQPLFSQ